MTAEDAFTALLDEVDSTLVMLKSVVALLHSQAGCSAIPRATADHAPVLHRFLVNPPSGQESILTAIDVPRPATVEARSVTGSFLSRLTSLVSATVSSAERSPVTLLRSLPPSLQTLEIVASGQSIDFHPNLLGSYGAPPSPSHICDSKPA